MDQLSSVIVHYLSQALGTLFEGDFSEKNLSLELTSGILSLRDVQLKEQFFRDLPVTLILSHGSIGKLDITIPWRNIGNAPLCVSIDKVNVLLRPCFAKDTQSSAARKAHQIKLAKLSSVESLCRLRGKSSSHSSAASFLFHYFKEKVARVLFNTLEISVRNVHIRFEDQVSCDNVLGGVCLGFTLDSLHLRPACHRGYDSSRSNDRRCDSIGGDIGTGRLLGLGAIRNLLQTADTLQLQCDITDVAMYCNELNVVSKNICCVPFVGKSSADIKKVMHSTIPRKWRLPPMHAYILQPHNFSLKFGMNFSNGDMHIGIEVSSDDVTCEVEDVQIHNISSFIHFTDVYMAANQFSEYRPDDGVRNQTSRGRRSRNPAAWWRFAIRAVRAQLGHFSRLRLSASSVDKYFADKMVYTGRLGGIVYYF